MIFKMLKDEGQGHIETFKYQWEQKALKQLKGSAVVVPKTLLVRMLIVKKLLKFYRFTFKINMIVSHEKQVTKEKKMKGVKRLNYPNRA